MPQKEHTFIQPGKLIMYLLLMSITALFLAFSLSYLFTRFDSGVPPVHLPSLFYFNSLLLIGSSFTLISAQKSYEADDTTTYKRSLIYTLILSVLFLLAQIIAWRQFHTQDIFIDYSNMASYIYLISGVHLIHLVFGIPFLIKFIFDAFRYMKSPVSVMIYFSDPAKRLKLDLFNIYWHYLDILWIYLVLFFFINYLLG